MEQNHKFWVCLRAPGLLLCPWELRQPLCIAAQRQKKIPTVCLEGQMLSQLGGSDTSLRECEAF